ncbi:MAG: hypothetical protein ACREEW_03750 [Caulobacteraceae bacterium]
MAQSVSSASGSHEAPHGEPAFHNSVLIREHEVRKGRGWIVIAPIAVAVVAGLAALVYVRTHPAPPLVNHAVAEASPAAGGQ